MALGSFLPAHRLAHSLVFTEQVAKVDLLATAQGLRTIYPHSSWLRVNGPYGYDATLALIATMLLFALLPSAFASNPRSGERSRIVSGTTCLLLGSAVFFTFFRVFWVVVVVGVLIVSLATGKGYLRRAVIVALVVATIGAALVYRRANLSEFYRERLANPSNLYYRLATYRMAWQMARESPWFGVGFGNFVQAARQRPTEAYRGHRALDYPHSGYFLLLSETGVPGLMLYLGAMGYLLRVGINRLRRLSAQATALGLVLALAGYLLANLVLSLFTDPSANQLVFFLGGALLSRKR